MSGGLSSAMMKPKPSVTALVASGSMKTASSQRPPRRTSRYEAIMPSATASTVVASAKRSELPTASIGGTNSTELR